MSSDLVVETSSNSATEGVILGRVKWFNNKAGYGFITITDGERSGKDVFVHHSGIKVGSEQYRYLVQGEYVQFELDNTPSGAHEVQAKLVGGINGGMLMCETRRDFRQTRVSYKSTKENVETTSLKPRSARPPRSSDNSLPRGRGPRERDDWNLVKKEKKSMA
jgi:cold shock protein